jgi:arylsulfatase A-like enzyme/Tfp pilus assembly protein PilF
MTGRCRWIFMAVVLILGVGCGREQPLNVLLFTFDTTRADHLGCYGKETARTPNLDRLAEDGALFDRAYTAIPITLPSHATIFTGNYPPVHGVRDNGLFQLPEDQTTLAEILRSRGYATAAAIGAFPLTREFGVGQGFDFFEDHITIAAEDYLGRRMEEKEALFFDERSGARVNDAILPWLRQRREKPFFAWIHYWDPHHPHLPPPPFNELYAHDLYQGEIAFADHCFGTVMREIESMGVADRTIVVMVGDHGEGRGEHDEDSHSLLAYNSTLRVPLIVATPGGPGKGVRIHQRVGTVDILPTVLDLLSLPIPEEIQGRSLVPVMRDPSADPGENLYYAETLSPRLSHGWGEIRALFLGSLKYLHGPRLELFDVRTDRHELDDLLHSRSDDATRMRDRLATFVAESAGLGNASAVYELDRESRLRLEALGYISVAGDGAATIEEELRSDGIAPQDRIGDITKQSLIKQRLEAQQYLSAKELGIELLESDPDNAFNRGMLALAYVGLGQVERAADVLEESAILATSNDSIALNIGRRLYEQGDETRGERLVERVLAARPSAYGSYLLAEMRWARGEREGALQLFDGALEIDPALHRARLGLAIHLSELGRVEDAEFHFRRLLEEHPLHAKGHTNFGILLLKNERLDEGRRHLRRAIELEPSYWQARLALIAGLLDAGLDEEAAKAVEELRLRCNDQGILGRAYALVEAS